MYNQIAKKLNFPIKDFGQITFNLRFKLKKSGDTWETHGGGRRRAAAYAKPTHPLPTNQIVEAVCRSISKIKIR